MREVSWSVLCLATVLSQEMAIAQVQPSLVGTLYRGTPSLLHTQAAQARPSRDRATGVPAAVGYQIYLRPLISLDWRGPVLTDSYGRFSFDRLAPGSYQLRAYDGPVRVWDQVVKVPIVMQPIVVRDLTVVYYPKTSDGDTVERVLQAIGYPFQHGVSNTPSPTNAVQYGEQINLLDAKKVAAQLIASGVKIKGVSRIPNSKGVNSKVIRISNVEEWNNCRPLTAARVLAATQFPLTDCP